MRKAHRAAVVALLTFSATAWVARPTPADAQLAVICPTCSNLVTQLVQYALQAQQLARQVQSYQLQVQQYQNMITNTISLGSFNFSNVLGDINRIQGLLSQGSLLSSNVSAIIGRLQSAAAEQNLALTLPQNFPGQISQWQTALGNSSQAMQQQLQQAPLLQAQGSQTLQNAQLDSANAEGVKQAIQANSEIAAQGVDTLMQEHDTLIATANSIQTQFATQNERTAVGDQALANFLSGTPPAISGMAFGPGNL